MTSNEAIKKLKRLLTTCRNEAEIIDGVEAILSQVGDVNDESDTLLRRVYQNFKLNRTPGKYEVFNNHSTYQREISPLIKKHLNEQ